MRILVLMFVVGALAVSAFALAAAGAAQASGGCSGKLYASGNRVWVDMETGSFSSVTFGTGKFVKVPKYETKRVWGKIPKLVEVQKGKYETHRWVFQREHDGVAGAELPGLGRWVQEKLPAPVWVTWSEWELREVEGWVTKRVKVGTGIAVRGRSNVARNIVVLGPGRAMVTKGEASAVRATVLCDGGRKLHLAAQAPDVDAPVARAAQEMDGGHLVLRLEGDHVSRSPRAKRPATKHVPKRPGDTFSLYLTVSGCSVQGVAWVGDGVRVLSSSNDHATVKVKGDTKAGSIVRVKATVTGNCRSGVGLPVESVRETEFTTTVVDANRR